jgi:hypothetical protein
MKSKRLPETPGSRLLSCTGFGCRLRQIFEEVSI